MANQIASLCDRIVGLNEKVVNIGGEIVREVNLDCAATTPDLLKSPKS